MNGKLIVIEGLDGSGKATQTEILKNELLKRNFPVTAISFPDYESDSSAAIKMYLNGELGSIDDVNVYAASSFYSIDRYISFKTKWRKSYEDGNIILADRYTTSNLCHQMSKLPMEKRDDYIKWLYNYEFELLKIPCPDLVIYLDMEPAASQKLISGRYKGDEEKKDLHESNFEYLLKCRSAALFSANKLGWNVISCNTSQNIPLTVEEISKKIYDTIVADKVLEGLC